MRFILPLALPEGVTEAEQVTDAIVNELGVVVNDTQAFDRWVYFATPDEASGRSYLSIMTREDNVAPESGLIPQFFLPGESITVERGTPIPFDQPQPTPAVTQPVTLADWLRNPLVMGLAIIITIFVLVVIIRASRRRKAKPTYMPPEIEVETFQTEGVVPDLNAIETAFYMGNSTKTLALIVLSLEQKGIVDIVNRNPLQMQIIDKDAAAGRRDKLPVYEQALLAAHAGRWHDRRRPDSGHPGCRGQGRAAQDVERRPQGHPRDLSTPHRGLAWEEYERE